jgi:hypothetical protein
MLRRGILCLTVSLTPFLLTSRVAHAETNRDPNSWETAYAIVGVDAESPEVCAKISPFAVDGAGFAAFGKQTWYVQSRCYYDIAVQTGNARLCTHVRSAHPLSSQVPS